MLAKNPRLELRIVRLCLGVSVICLGGIAMFLSDRLVEAYQSGDGAALAEVILFGICMLVLAYGNLLYQFCLRGHYRRQLEYRPTPREALEGLYDRPAPSLAVLVPAYKEEKSVIWQTLVSSALAEYPAKDIVLLIDDPYYPRSLDDRLKLEETRRIPQHLQEQFERQAAYYREEQRLFSLRRQPSKRFRRRTEAGHLAGLYRQAADWLAGLEAEVTGDRPEEALTHGECFFLREILRRPAEAHRERAARLEAACPSAEALAHEYRRLTGLFTVRFSSFERKKYANLSQEANKSMNLNSYIGLMGRNWREVERDGEWLLLPAAPGEASLTVPAYDYVNTIDADSLMTHDYALKLVHLLEQPEHMMVAAAQSPCSSIPGSDTGIERIAGACIDIQFLTHQGYMAWDAAFWIGANAMLRREALEDIREERVENGYPIAIYIQDRTVIEDTESSIDLVAKGLKLYNHPERMTFSTTPADFGSLLIQRRRWANGGMLILPKLLAYAWRQPKTLRLAREMFMRFNYLASTTLCCLVSILLFTYPFTSLFESPWIGLATVPYLLLLARDFRSAGYAGTDVLRSYALNLMLLPVIIGGVLKQFQQGVTGAKIPFGRTPKVPGRTAAPVLYCLAELLLPLLFLAAFWRDVEQQRWTKAAFDLLTAGCFLYALTCLIGVRPLLEDIAAGIRTRWRLSFHHAEIIPLPQAETVAPVSCQEKQSA